MLRTTSKLFFVHRKVMSFCFFVAGVCSLWLLMERAYDIGNYRDLSRSVKKLSAIMPWLENKVKLRHETHANLSIIGQKMCKLPKVNPFDENVMKNIRNYGPLECKGQQFSRIENNTLIIESFGAKLKSIVYSPIRRPRGDDFSFKYGKWETIFSTRVKCDSTHILATGMFWL